MSIALLIARVVLAVVFLVAGLAKLADRAGSRQALLDFGLPAALATPGGILLPLAELAVAVALLPLVSAWWAALGALALLVLFISGVGFNLARGRKPNCHCFGQLYSKPIGWPTLVRNVLLAALAGFILGFGSKNPGLDAFSWLASLTLVPRLALLAAVLLAALFIAAGWLIVQMLKQQGRLLLRIEALEERLAAGGAAGQREASETQTAPQPGLPVGTPAPAFALPGLYGETITLDFLRAAGKPILLLFSDPGCGPCNALLPEIGRWQREYAGKLNLALISRGTPESNRAKSTEHGITQVLIQHDREIAEAYQCSGTPGAVVVRSDGQIASPLSLGAEAIRALVAGAAGLPVLGNVPSSNAPGGNALPLAPAANGNGSMAAPNSNQAGQAAIARTGTQAPDFRLPDLSGNMVSLADYRGSKTLLLFWNPGCGFCQRMLDDLKAWEADPPAGAPRLLVVSTGSAEENRALGLRAPVLLDQGMSVGSRFGANGTPMAVQIDAQGNVASEVAAGAPAVLALAGGQAPSNGNGAAAPTAPRALKVGETAPAFSLPNLSGKRVNLSDFRGSKLLLLFWRPSCGFCERMLDDLKAWEAKPPTGAPKLLVISTDSVADNQAMGLRSPVLLDQDGMRVGSKFGATGTPMGVLVDAQGKIASELAVGASAVLALAGQDTGARA